jgi:hypothetical protein
MIILKEIFFDTFLAFGVLVNLEGGPKLEEYNCYSDHSGDRAKQFPLDFSHPIFMLYHFLRGSQCFTIN